MQTERFAMTVEAATIHSLSLKRLAEALATDIPQRASRHDAETSVRKELVDARSAILAAGGEDRSVATLWDYRKVALWARTVSVNAKSSFAWVDGASFTVHKEAQAVGWSIEKLRHVMETGGVTVAELREMNGRQIHGFDGPKKTSSERFVQAARTVFAMSIAYENDEWKMDTDAEMAFHYLKQYFGTRGAITPDLVDDMIEDIYEFIGQS